MKITKDAVQESRELKQKRIIMLENRLLLRFVDDLLAEGKGEFHDGYDHVKKLMVTKILRKLHTSV